MQLSTANLIFTGNAFCVINGDLVTSLRVDEMLEFHKSNGGIATISLWEVEDPHDSE